MTASCPLCVICTTEREATHGYLCTGHFERLARMLRDVELEVCLLDARPSMAIRTGSGGGSLASERSPVRLDVLALLDRRTYRYEKPSIGPWCPDCWHGTCVAMRAWDDAINARATEAMSVLETLHGWARLIREERDLTPPETVTISGERDLLTRQLDWLAEQSFIDEPYRDIRQLLGQLKGVNGTTDEKPVGRCYLPAEVGICDGPIWVDTAMGHAHCGRCTQTWDGPQLAMLHFELEQQKAEAARPKTEDGRRMLTAQEMAARLGVSVNAVRIIVSRSRGRIVAVHGHYDPDDFAERMTA